MVPWRQPRILYTFMYAKYDNKPEYIFIHFLLKHARLLPCCQFFSLLLSYHFLPTAPSIFAENFEKQNCSCIHDVSKNCSHILLTFYHPSFAIFTVTSARLFWHLHTVWMCFRPQSSQDWSTSLRHAICLQAQACVPQSFSKGTRNAWQLVMTKSFEGKYSYLHFFCTLNCILIT